MLQSLKKRVLFLSPSIMGLYLDIKAELERQGYEVVFIEDNAYASRRFDDPLRVVRDWARFYSFKKKEKFNILFWKELFESPSFNSTFDYLFVIDGFKVCDYLIDSLKQKNPKIKKILYLYDSVRNVYRFDLNFYFFDKIYTFDIDDSETFHLNLLPIYWVPYENKKCEYDIFGFAGFGTGLKRYKVYKNVAALGEKYGLRTYIKLYHVVIKNSKLKLFFRKLLKRDAFLQVSNDGLIVDKPLKADDFRKYIASSNVVLDALSNVQTGMTTRFSWAIGAGKKIITNNENVVKYPFYDSQRIFIYKEGTEVPKSFFIDDVAEDADARKEIDKFKIDNWIAEMFN